MKKAGQFFFIFIPSLLTAAVQFLVLFFLMGITGLVEAFGYIALQGKTSEIVLGDLFNLWLTQDFNTWIMVFYGLLNISIFGLWYYMRYDGDYLPKPKTVFHPVSILGIIMLVPGMQYLSSYIVSFTASLFPKSLEVYESLLESAGLDDTITVSMFLYSVLLAPFAEELVFRGVTLRQARKCLPFWGANLMQAFLFGVFHMNLIQGVYAFALGLILGYICEKSGSIYNAILLHLLFNFWATALSQFFYIGDGMFSFLFWFVFAAAMTAGGIVVFTLGIKRITLKKEEAENAAAPVP